MWIKRGDYVVCEPIAEGDKVRAEIVHVVQDPRDLADMIASGDMPRRFIDTDDNLKVAG